MDNGQRWRAYEICLERGHDPDNKVLTSNPPQLECRFCKTIYRFEERLVEVNAPVDPSRT